MNKQILDQTDGVMEASTVQLRKHTSDQTDVVMEASTVQLRKELGLVGASSIVIGMIIGSGIFVSPKGVLRATGSVGLCLLVWVIAGIVQLGTSLCFAELGAMIHVSGGTYTYLRMGIGNHLAFLNVLLMVTVLAPSSLTIILLTFAKYLVTLLPVCGSPATLEKFIAATALITLAVINSYSSRFAAHISIITTVGKVGALVVVIISGVVVICQGTTSELGTGFEGTSQDPSSLALAMYSASFSYGGGENLNFLVEEIRKPEKNLPRAAIIGILMVIVIYIMTNVAYLSVMTRSEMLAAEAVAVVFGNRVLGPAAKIIPVAVMVSTFGTANNAIFSRSRVIFAAARDKNFPDFLGYIQVKHLTPLAAMIISVTFSLILLVTGEISALMNYVGFLSSFFQVCVLSCLLVFRYKTMKKAKRPIKVPVVIPILMILLNVYLFMAPLVIKPDLRYVYIIAGVILASSALYIPFIHYRISVPFYEKIVTWIQLTFEVSPPTKVE